MLNSCARGYYPTQETELKVICLDYLSVVWVTFMQQHMIMLEPIIMAFTS